MVSVHVAMVVVLLFDVVLVEISCKFVGARIVRGRLVAYRYGYHAYACHFDARCFWFDICLHLVCRLVVVYEFFPILDIDAAMLGSRHLASHQVEVCLRLTVSFLDNSIDGSGLLVVEHHSEGIGFYVARIVKSWERAEVEISAIGPNAERGVVGTYGMEVAVGLKDVAAAKRCDALEGSLQQAVLILRSCNGG